MGGRSGPGGGLKVVLEGGLKGPLGGLEGPGGVRLILLGGLEKGPRGGSKEVLEGGPKRS